MKENESLRQSLEIMKEREKRREEDTNTVRTKEELLSENSSLLRVNEKMKGEILTLQEELRLQNNRREINGRMPLREDRFESLRKDNDMLMCKVKEAEAKGMQLKMELN